ncbi:hypothetical protein bcgnr5378_07760 [Bacillus cereus]|uniref:hypothetical protein n=1 Tax=Bacillus cereus TaxID=1396 RepID=UPI0007AC0FFE|nr:hypothetical protein [Bacillus cereus]
MSGLTKFMYSPHWDPENPYWVYSVGCTKPETTSGYIQGFWRCTHCGKGNQFRFYDDTYWPNYYVNCPDCHKEFVAVEDSYDNE